MGNKISLTPEKKKVLWRYILFTVVTIFAAILFLNTIIIHDDEVAIISRLGKSHKVVNRSGIYVLIPFIDSSTTISKKVTETIAVPILVTTKDRRELYVEAYAIWQLSNPVLFIYTNGGKDPSSLIEGYLSGAIPSAANSLSYEEIKASNNSAGGIEGKLKKEIGDKAFQNGIDVKDVFIKSVYLSTKSEETVIARMKTDCEKIAASIIAEGQDESRQIKAAGDREATLISKKAELEVSTSRSAADIEAAKIYSASYGKDLEFYEFVNTLELYKESLKDQTTIIFPGNSPFAKYLVK